MVDAITLDTRTTRTRGKATGTKASVAGALIAQEAGAQISGLDGRSFDWTCRGVLAASPALYPALAQLFVDAR